LPAVSFACLLPFYTTAEPGPDSTAIRAVAPLTDSLMADTLPEKGRWIGIGADTVLLKNGDRLTGHILSFEQGRLKLDAYGPGVTSIKWHKIAFIHGGSRLFRIEDDHGLRYFGYIRHAADSGSISLSGQVPFSIRLEDVVRIYPMEDQWYRGFKGDAGAGISYDKASEVLRINMDYNLYYILSRWSFYNSFSFIETSTQENEPSYRIQANLMELYSLPKKWVLAENTSFTRNDELGVRARISFNLGGGNSLVQTDRQRLLLLTGIVHVLERDAESQSMTTSREWPFSVQYTVYSFDSPNLSSTVTATSFVGITEKGRYRLDTKADVSWEFIPNLQLQVSFYYNFDNKIIEGKNTQDDYGTALSLRLELK
jgi:hypothetical protein